MTASIRLEELKSQKKAHYKKMREKKWEPKIATFQNQW